MATVIRVIAPLALLLVALYAGAYLLLVDRGPGMGSGPTQSYHVYYSPIYRIGGERTYRFFEPAHRIDAWIRPGHWHWHGPLILTPAPSAPTATAAPVTPR